MKPIWNMGYNIIGRCRARRCVCMCNLFCYCTTLMLWASFNDVTLMMILHVITRPSHFISLNTTKCAGSYGNIKLHAPGGVAQHLSWGLTLCVHIQILKSKVVWVGFHI
jgi:hypothetical protein